MRRALFVVVALVAFGCSGEDGVDSLVDISDEAAGDNCAAGGVAIATGDDDDGDGILDPGEVADTNYVCNPGGDAGGADGVQLVRLDDEPPGVNCAFGGVAVNSGTDADDNGTLEDTEIETTTYVCDGAGATTANIIEGNISITSSLDAQLLAVFSEVTGNLQIQNGLPMTDLEFPNLVTVGGRLTGNNDSLANLSFPALTSVGDFVDIVAGDELTTLSMPVLATVAGRFEVAGSGTDLTIDASALTSTGDHLRIRATGATSLDISSLVTVGNRFWIEDTALVAIAAPALTTIDNDLWINDNSSLTSLAFAAPLTTVVDEVEITGNDSLPCADANAVVAALTTFGGSPADIQDCL